MFGWLTGKNKTKAPPKDETPEEKSARIREEALANAKAAREAIGEDALDKIAASMQRKQQASAAIDAAKKRLETGDKDRVNDILRDMMRDKD